MICFVAALISDLQIIRSNSGCAKGCCVVQTIASLARRLSCWLSCLLFFLRLSCSVELLCKATEGDEGGGLVLLYLRCKTVLVRCTILLFSSAVCLLHPHNASKRRDSRLGGCARLAPGVGGETLQALRLAVAVEPCNGRCGLSELPQTKQRQRGRGAATLATMFPTYWGMVYAWIEGGGGQGCDIGRMSGHTKKCFCAWRPSTLCVRRTFCAWHSLCLKDA